MGRVQDKVALVTGGAAGIGEAMVRMLAAEGAKVIVTDIQDGAGEAVAEDVAAAGGEALFLHHDVASETEWESVIARAIDRFGRLDIVVNNAGIAYGSAPDEQTLEEWRRLMSINLDGVFLGTKHAIRAMKIYKPQTMGSIVNLSSVEGIVGDPNLGAYNAAKGGVRIYTKSVALYCANNRLGIRVNSVHPGYIWTPMVESYLRQAGSVVMGRRVLDQKHPIGHVGEPDDIAYGVLYLASDEAKFVTGAELVIDGGYTAQ